MEDTEKIQERKREKKVEKYNSKKEECEIEYTK